MERTFWAGGQGFGYIGSDLKKLEITEKEVIINGEVIKPNTMTTLSGFYNSPMRYMGIDNSQDFKDDMIMLFYMGSNQELFTTHYVDCVCWINELRLFVKYGEHFGRDFNLKKGKWK